MSSSCHDPFKSATTRCVFKDIGHPQVDVSHEDGDVGPQTRMCHTHGTFVLQCSEVVEVQEQLNQMVLKPNKLSLYHIISLYPFDPF